MSRNDLLDQVRELRRRGMAPKQIARDLGVPKADVAPLLRQVAGSQRVAGPQPPADPADQPVLGCWISPGWSSGLGLDRAPEWADADPEGRGETIGGGLAGVVVVRSEPGSRATFCGFLVDVYCLGVKNTIGPLRTRSGSVPEKVGRFFEAFGGAYRSVPLELAQHVVLGAVAYARGLGFEPHPEFPDVQPYLGRPATPCPITFGHDGKPLYMSGPYDDPMAIMETLGRMRSADEYDYLIRAVPGL